MFKKIICKLFHRRHHEVGMSAMTWLDTSNQYWTCLWWCKKCGFNWQIASTIKRFTGMEWGPKMLLKGEYQSDGSFCKRDEIPRVEKKVEEVTKS